MVFLEDGLPGGWSSWGVVFLEEGLPGGWSSWGMVFLGVGLPGGWSSWGMVFLEDGLRQSQNQPSLLIVPGPGPWRRPIHTHTHTPTAIGCHARYQPAHQEQWRVRLGKPLTARRQLLVPEVMLFLFLKDQISQLCHASTLMIKE